ncbi:MAG: transglutaminase protein, partial [Firmicutes bacterium]|nr:transglutaminase protein [Bacillota bacterium]
RGFRYSAKAIEQNLQLTSPAIDPSTAGTKLLLSGTVGKVDPDFPYVLAVTHFGNLEATYRVPIKDGQFREDLHLRFGAGSYAVVLYTQVANTQLTELVRFTVTTSSAKDERDLLPSASIESDNAQIMALASELAGGKSAMEAGKAVFEWTARNVRYDRDKAASWRVDPDEGAERTLRTRTGVCRDYAALAVALLRAAGVKSHIVTGRAGSGYDVAGHAWVEFYNGDRWVEMDPTFASGVVSGTGFVPRYDARYFDPAPDFLKTTHTREGIQY